jgi:hypothetical protein
MSFGGTGLCSCRSHDRTVFWRKKLGVARGGVSETRVMSCAGKGHHQYRAKGFACPWEIVPLSRSGHPDIVMPACVYRNVRVLFEKKIQYLIGNNNNNNNFVQGVRCGNVNGNRYVMGNCAPMWCIGIVQWTWTFCIGTSGFRMSGKRVIQSYFVIYAISSYVGTIILQYVNIVVCVCVCVYF